MTEPGVPGDVGHALELPCGETVDVHDLDMGLRELECDCGGTHAVVMDVHPLARFLPESIVAVLREAVDTADEFEELKLAHVMGMVIEEFPEEIAVADVSDDGEVGYTLLWVSEFDARRLHEMVVELVVELMEHAVSHAEDDGAVSKFEDEMHSFDVAAFVEQYREQREVETEHDSAI